MILIKNKKIKKSSIFLRILCTFMYFIVYSFEEILNISHRNRQDAHVPEELQENGLVAQ